MKLFYLTTEIIPFANTCSLAPFSTKVPLALQGMGHDIRTIIPKYGYVSERKYILREVIRLREIPFQFNGEDITVSAKSAFIPKTRVQVYFMEDNHWFKPLTNLVYKSKNGRILSDNDIRFAFFNKGTLAILPHLFWKPDIIICNGWQSAFVPAIYHQQYASQEFYTGIKTVLIIHQLDPDYTTFSDGAFRSIGLELPSAMEDGTVNAYVAAAEFADMVMVLDTPENKLTEQVLKIPAMAAYKDKLTTISVSADENPDYQQVAADLDVSLQKLID